MATIPALIRPRGFSLEFKVVVFAGAILTLGFSVIYPVVLLFVNSFVTTNPPVPAEYGLDAWRFAVSDRGMLIALWNSMVVTFLRQGISFPIAILLAWLIARTNMPGAKWLEFGFWIAFFLPVVSVTQAWILLALPPQAYSIRRWNTSPSSTKGHSISTLCGASSGCTSLRTP